MSTDAVTICYPFTVVGYYTDTRQRFCDTIDASDATSAELLAMIEHPTLMVAAVFFGDVTPVDTTS